MNKKELVEKIKELEAHWKATVLLREAGKDMKVVRKNQIGGERSRGKWMKIVPVIEYADERRK